MIQGVIKSKRLTSGEAAKMKGKLGFAASHFWGKIGRCCMRCLSERQYSKTLRSGLNEALLISIIEWVKIITQVVPKSLTHGGSETTEVIIYTDGYFPDPRKQQTEEPTEEERCPMNSHGPMARGPGGRRKVRRTTPDSGDTDLTWNRGQRSPGA